jgi:hypothetical protein
LYSDVINNPDDPKYYWATVIKIDPKIDLALIQLQEPPKSLSVMRLGTLPAIGSDVHAIGHPFGENWSYVAGYISQIRNEYEWDYYDIDSDSDKDDAMPTSSHRAQVIQTQTPINPGNSGGPLIDTMARLIGINSFGTMNAEGVNYAVSVTELKSFMAQKKPEIGPMVDPSAFVEARDLNEDGRNDAWGYDLDDDELIDVVAYDEDNDGIPDEWALLDYIEGEYITVGRVFTVEEGGRLEVIWMIDTDQDNEADYYGFDYNRDGRPDFMREFSDT